MTGRARPLLADQGRMRERGGTPAGFIWHFVTLQMAVHAIVCSDSAIWAMTATGSSNLAILSLHHQFLMRNVIILGFHGSFFLLISMKMSGLHLPPVIFNTAALIPAFCAGFLSAWNALDTKGKTLLKLQLFFFSFCLDLCSSRPCVPVRMMRSANIFYCLLIIFSHAHSSLMQTKSFPAAVSSQYEAARCFCCKDVKAFVSKLAEMWLTAFFFI